MNPEPKPEPLRLCLSRQEMFDLAVMHWAATDSGRPKDEEYARLGVLIEFVSELFKGVEP